MFKWFFKYDYRFLYKEGPALLSLLFLFLNSNLLLSEEAMLNIQGEHVEFQLPSETEVSSEGGVFTFTLNESEVEITELEDAMAIAAARAQVENLINIAGQAEERAVSERLTAYKKTSAKVSNWVRLSEFRLEMVVEDDASRSAIYLTIHSPKPSKTFALNNFQGFLSSIKLK
jgi:hypothetical protein